MIGTTPVILALGGGPVRLLGAGAMLSSLGFARASAASGRGADDATFLMAAAGTARFQGSARRLLVEGARTNAIRNPRAEGATVGGAGSSALPGFWGNFSSGGLTATVAGTGTASGLPYLDLAFTGTTSGTSAAFSFDTASLAVTAGQQVTHSVYLALVGGSLANLSSVNNRNVTSGGTGTASQNVLASLSGALTRFGSTVTAGAGATAMQHYLSFSFAPGAAVNFTLRIACPQIELGAFASSPILPAAGAPAVTARAADVPSCALPPQGTLVGTFLLPQSAPAGLDQGLLQLDDGTDTNRLVLQNAGGGNAVQALVASGGSTLATLAAGSMVPGTAFRAAIGWNAAGVSACLGGGAVQSSGTLPAGLSRLLIGHASAGLGRAAFGEAGPLDLHATRLPDAALQALTSN